MITSKACVVPDCTCVQFQLALQFEIKTILDTDGNSRVSLVYGPNKLQLVADAAVQIGLNLISAAYAARGEEALFQYSKIHDLDISELLKLERY